MSRILANFESLLDAQERATGARITATIGEITADCIPSAGNSDLIQLDGGSAISGGYTLQMRASDFAEKPSVGDAASVSCYEDRDLHVTSDPEEAGAILTIRIGDLAAA